MEGFHFRIRIFLRLKLIGVINLLQAIHLQLFSAGLTFLSFQPNPHTSRYGGTEYR